MIVNDTLTEERLWPLDEHQLPNLLTHALCYAHAMPFVQGKVVVDLCCGTGYGTRLLSEAAHSVRGVDYSQTAINYNESRGLLRNCRFVLSDVDDFFSPGIEVVTCFQGLEHLVAPQDIILKWLNAGATFIFAVPNGGLDNPHHHHNLEEYWWQNNFPQAKLQRVKDRSEFYKGVEGEFQNIFGIITPR